MSVFKYLQESLISEALPLKIAKKYTKQGKENSEELPDEYKEAYANMFGGKNRIQIGNVSLPKDETKTRELQKDLQDLVKFMKDNKNENAPVDILDKLEIYGPYPKDTRYIDVKFNDESVKKELSQALDPKINKYLFKTVIKRLKKYVSKDKQNELSQKAGQILTKGSNISQETTAPVILSKHPYDVAGMSTGKRWQSCKNTVDGCNRHYLDTEVGHLLIAFVANPNAKGKDLLSDPYSRLLVMPVTGDNGYGLYVSSDIYGMEIPGFHSIVEQYVSEFMPVYDDSDEKETVGKYYEDSSFRNEEQRQERMWTAFEDAWDNLSAKFNIYVPETFENMLNDKYREELVGNIEPEDFEDEMTLSDNIITEINNLFEYFDNLGMDADDYIDTYLDQNLDRFLDEVLTNYTAEDIVRDMLEGYPADINNFNEFGYMLDNSIIDDVSEFVNNVMSNNPDTLTEFPKFSKALIEYVIRHENDNWVTDNTWIDDIDLDELWNSTEDVEFDDFYGFARFMGIPNEKLVEIFGESENIDDSLKDTYDKLIADNNKQGE